MPSDLQGHRGARGLRPENTLPSFEVALDAGVTSIETDVHLTADGVPVVYHDARISPDLCRRRRGSRVPPPSHRPLLSSLSAAEVTGYIADRNPDPRRFPEQKTDVTPVAALFAEQQGLHPYAVPTLALVLAFADAYAGALGKAAGKTPTQRSRAQQTRFDLELKRVPFYPEAVGDVFDGEAPGLLEKVILDVARDPHWGRRVAVRSFDHRSVRALTQALPDLPAAVLIAETAPVDPAALVRAAGADTYCPDYRFLDERQVRQCHAAGVRVIPWTVNALVDSRRLFFWEVDGITTDYPGCLRA